MNAYKTFFASLRKAGFHVDRHVYKRSSQSGKVCGYFFGEKSSSRPLIVFAHGYGNDAFYPYVQIFEKFLENNFNVFTFDLDGHGVNSSTFLDIKNFSSSVVDAVEFAKKEFKPEKIFGVGHSLGGAIFLNNASDLSQLGVLALVCISVPSTVEIGWRGIIFEGLSLFSTNVLIHLPKYGLVDFLPAFGRIRRKIMPIRARDDYMPSLKRLFEDLIHAAPQSNTPIKFIYGDADRLASKRCYEGFSRVFPGAEKYMVKGATHMTLPYNSEMIDESIAFLKKY